MTFEHAREVINTVTYKPHSTVCLEKEDITRLVIKLRITEAVPNTKIKSDMLTASYKIDLDYINSGVELLITVRDLIHRLEKHESDEWFRVGGCVFYNPHANL